MNLNQALTKLVKPQLKLMQIWSRNVTSLLFISKYRNKLNGNLKTNSLNTQMSISSSAMIRQKHTLKLPMPMPMTSPIMLCFQDIYHCYQKYKIRKGMLRLDKSFILENFLMGALQVMSYFILEKYKEFILLKISFTFRSSETHLRIIHCYVQN
jgi:hypothetical protein